MNRMIVSLLLAAILLIGTLIALQAKPDNFAGEPAAVLSQTAVPAGVHNLQTTENGLSFDLSATEPIFSEAGQMLIAGLNAVVNQPGAPELPYYATYIALPPEAEMQISVEAVETTAVARTYIQPVPQPVLDYANTDGDESVPETAVLPDAGKRLPNPAIYRQNNPFPGTAYTLSAPVYARDMRLVRLNLFPLQYNPLFNELQQSQFKVTITFSGGRFNALNPAPSQNDSFQQNMAGQILNFDQARNWRSLPASAQTANTLPLGRELYKIELHQDGVYEISGADLAAAGMDTANVDPAAIEMAYRGEPVAYQLLDNGDAVFDDSDVIRFYGWAVSDTRREKQFLNENVFWLWADGTPATITATANLPGPATVTTYTASLTREDENLFFSTWTSNWDAYANEADSWYWQYMTKNTRYPDEPLTLTLTNIITNPALTAAYTVEIMTKEFGAVRQYEITTCLNSYPQCEQTAWAGRNNLNITGTVPITALAEGGNTFQVNLDSPAGDYVRVYLNRITVDFPRYLRAENDQIIFPDEIGGRKLAVGGFTTNNPADILVWDITDRRQPTAVTLTNSDISADAGSYTIALGRSASAPQTFIAATVTNTLTSAAMSISQYNSPATMLPPGGGAEWLAITHGRFTNQANTLAAHRQNPAYGGLQTHVVNVEDIINVYGFGRAMPEAIQAYLRDALTWPLPPSYVLLFGDGVVAPRNLDCTHTSCGSYKDSNGDTQLLWDKDAENLVPTDMLFVDRFQGLIPSDYTYTLLSGSDELPDLALGRLAAETTAEADAIVGKIIKYEENLIDPSYYASAPWQKRIMFVADNTDEGGDFCASNEAAGAFIPDDYEQIHLCLPEDTVTATNTLRDAMYEEILNQNGISIMNYRGHGSSQSWAGSGGILNTSKTHEYDDNSGTWVPVDHTNSFWDNQSKPVVIISADCLDGHFGWPGKTGLGERFLMKGDPANGDFSGTAAHWSSSGLGYTFEHTVLVNSFYTAIFEQDNTRIGDAVNYAKVYYHGVYDGSESLSELYSFNLQGDPAMYIVNWHDTVYLPAIMKGS
jgi:hypothetical protein